MKKALTILSVACALLVGTLGAAEAQYANAYNAYGYNSYASQMVRDNINSRRFAERQRTRRTARKSQRSKRSRRHAVKARRSNRRAR